MYTASCRLGAGAQAQPTGSASAEAELVLREHSDEDIVNRVKSRQSVEANELLALLLSASTYTLAIFYLTSLLKVLKLYSPCMSYSLKMLGSILRQRLFFEVCKLAGHVH